MQSASLSPCYHQVLHLSERCHRTAILFPDEESTLQGLSGQPAMIHRAQIGLHLELEALAMRLSRCCASQPIAGEIEEKDDIIGKLGQTQTAFCLSCPPAHGLTAAEIL